VSLPRMAMMTEPAAATTTGSTMGKYGVWEVVAPMVLIAVAVLVLWGMVKRPVQVSLDGRSGSALGLATGDEELLADLSGLDAESRRRQRLEGKVKDMVTENPQDAAKLVTRWVHTE
jgi:flagellar biosynthesis/type III secretory pathway M-ring protein FliF/YscJ